MSLESWKNIYYPTSADTVTTQAEAIAHSLLKWSGLKPEVLTEHGVERCLDSLRVITEDENTFRAAAGDTCALCWIDLEATATDKCHSCSLFESRGNVSCLSKTPSETTPPYLAYIEGGDPEPMLIELRKAQAWVEARDKPWIATDPENPCREWRETGQHCLRCPYTTVCNE